MICDRGDVVVVPFPFSEGPGHKRRPALVLSRKSFNRSGHSILAMITSAAHDPWPGDTPVTDLRSAGLRVECVIRLKIFTLDNRLVLTRRGRLSARDIEAIGIAVASALS